MQYILLKISAYMFTQEYFKTTYKFMELSPHALIPMHGRVNLWPKHMLCGYLKYELEITPLFSSQCMHFCPLTTIGKIVGEKKSLDLRMTWAFPNIISPPYLRYFISQVKKFFSWLFYHFPLTKIYHYSKILQNLRSKNIDLLLSFFPLVCEAGLGNFSLLSNTLLLPENLTFLHQELPKYLNPWQTLSLIFRNRRSRETSIVKAIENGAQTLYDIVANVYSEVDRRLWIPAASNVRLHVDHLAQQAKLPKVLSQQFSDRLVPCCL